MDILSPIHIATNKQINPKSHVLIPVAQTHQPPEESVVQPLFEALTLNNFFFTSIVV